MFDLMPFGYERSLLDSFDNFEKEFFKGMNRSLASFRTDIQDKGDHYVLEAELPGFAKEDIHIDLDDNYLTIRAEHKEEKRTRMKRKPLSAKSVTTARMNAGLTYPASMWTQSRPAMKTAC